MYDNGEPPAKKRCKYNLRSYSTKLLDLNDDCLDEIFNHLDVIKLCSVSRVSKRLQQLAKSHFNRKYREFDFSTVFAERIISNREVADVLCIFGSMIRAMNIQTESFHNHEAIGHVEECVLKNVAGYCSNKLIGLQLTKFCFTSRAVETLNSLSDSLVRLALLNSDLAEGCTLRLNNFSSLKTLSLKNSNYALMDTFPNLITLQLNKVSVTSQSMLQDFIVRHSQLETILISNCKGVSSAMVRHIAKYVKGLEVFDFHWNVINPSESLEEIKENLFQLCEMKKLTILGLSCTHLSIGDILVKMLSKKIAITALNISSGKMDGQTIEAIVQMKYLHHLHFYQMNSLKNEHLIKCVMVLTQLKILSIWYQPNITDVALKDVLRHGKQLMDLTICQLSFQLDSGLYNDILNIVKERRNGTKLVISIYSDGEQVSVPQRTIQANKNWLIVQSIKSSTKT